MNPLSRRKFLEKSALAAAAMPAFNGLILSSSKAQSVVGANDKIRIGLIGSGGRGRDVLGVFLSNPEIDCPIVCDVDDKMISQGAALVEKQRGKKPDTTKDFRRVIER